MSSNKLKIRLEYVHQAPYWKVYRLRPVARWFPWHQWEYLTLVSHVAWPKFKSEYEAHSGPVEVIRDDS